MDFTVLFNVLEQYGWTGVIGVAILAIIFFIIKYQLTKSDNKMQEGLANVANQITTCITDQNKDLLKGIQETNKTMLEYIIKDKRSEHDNNINHRLSIEEQINDKLHDMVCEYHANRVAIIEFHNSKENLDGLSFVWYDIHYEKFNKGTQDIMMQVQNQPSSILTPIVKKLRVSKYLLLSKEDLESMFDDAPVLYNQLNRIPGLEYIIYFGIYNTDNRLTGLLVCEWHKQIDVNNVYNNTHTMLNDVSYISSLINLTHEL